MNLVITRAPLRVSLVGGGSDLPGGLGATISSSIDKHVYCVAKRRNDDKVYLTWRRKEVVDNASELRHELVREAMLKLGIKNGVEILTFADVPGTGSGLGSSAATTVAVLHALLILDGWKDEQIDRVWLAELASDIEINRVGRSCGRQDQYASSIGGFLHLQFDDAIVSSVRRLSLHPNILERLNRSFLLFSPSVKDGRLSETVLSEFKDGNSFREDCLDLVSQALIAIEDHNDLERLPELVARHHDLKATSFPSYLPARLSSIKIPFKLCGAGATGHLLVGVTNEHKDNVIEYLTEVWGPELPFSFVTYGSNVLYTDRPCDG